MKALAEGTYIRHFQYGLGVITASDSERTSIDFDLHGPKKFVTSIMVVELAEGTPPKRRRVRKSKKAAPAPLHHWPRVRSEPRNFGPIREVRGEGSGPRVHLCGPRSLDGSSRIHPLDRQRGLP